MELRAAVFLDIEAQLSMSGGKFSEAGTLAKTKCKTVVKGCVPYISASLILSLNDSTCQTRKNIFYFTSKALFVLVKIKF